ncbi:General secretion pathway protein B [Photobacterium marinum]|uniref:General secretion pathway protein B n=1 Tax=Photobacterium marinum TaxID=1056511 RepID=L8J7D7_9GAMM|nr:general secretion pathway protein GspB [Photobacterium marinum]ELR64701.1 General secretion pathway protein B [Photobacterium marinum]
MSNLLNAIQQSEQHHQVYTSRPVQPLKAVAGSRSLSSWLLPALLVMVPVAGTLAYGQWHSQVQRESVSDVAARAVKADVVAVPVIEPVPVVATALVAENTSKPEMLNTGEGMIRVLPYPELMTEPLPSVNHRLSRQITQRTAQPVVTMPDTVYDQNPISNQSEMKVVSSQPAKNEWDLDKLDYSELSPQLAEQLKSAIAATDNSVDEEPSELLNTTSAPSAKSEIKPIALGELPASVQNRIPSLNFQTHIYSSTANSRWVKVNGREAFEGDEIAPGVVLRRIEPRQVVFDFDSYLVSMPALSEW